MSRGWIGPSLLLSAVLGTGAALAVWKVSSVRAADAGFASQPEPSETVSAAEAKRIEHRETATSIGTVVAIRSITLRNELAGTVRRVALVPGQIVEPGTLLVGLDVAVEEAELSALKARAALAETLLTRTERANQNRAVSESELDRARAERDVALAQIARTEAIIERKTMRAPFRARVGIADVHPGQYLVEGTLLTTLQGVDDEAYVDFTVTQTVAAALRAGDRIEVFTIAEARSIPAEVVAVDARVDPATRNAAVRAKVRAGTGNPAPGASVRVRVPVGAPIEAVSLPVSALRRGPAGDHVFVIVKDDAGASRARLRRVEGGPVLGDKVVIARGIEPGEQVAVSGSFKLFDGALVVIAADSAASPGSVASPGSAAAHGSAGANGSTVGVGSDSPAAAGSAAGSPTPGPEGE